MASKLGVWTMGELLVEIMRPQPGMPLDQPGEFLGPFPSGAPAIFIDTAARLGHPAGIIGGVGADDFGDCLMRRLERDGVKCEKIQRYPGYSTAVAFVTYFADGSRKFIYHIDRTPAVMNSFPGTEAMEDAEFFHVMGCSLMASGFMQAEIIKGVRLLSDQGIKISFDPNIRMELLRDHNLKAVIEPVLERCSVLLPGLNELLLMSGKPDADSAARYLFDRYAIEFIVLKQGKLGSSIFQRMGGRIDIPAYPIQEVDPTGAGDCFDAGFLCGLIDGCSLEDSARIASAAGALNAAAFGPMEGNISLESVRAFIDANKAIS